MTSRSARRLVVVALAAATLSVSACDGGRSANLDPDPTTAATVDPAAGAASVVSELGRALERGDSQAAVSLAGDRAGRRELRRLVANAKALRLRHLDLRYLSESTSSLTAAQEHRWGDSAWAADVQVTWRYGGVDAASSTLTIPVALRTRDTDVALLSADLSQTDRLPLWLDDRVEVGRGRDVLVVSTGRHSPSRFVGYAEHAVRDVRASLPRWRGVLCVEVAPDQPTFRDVAGLPQEQAAAIAAVTTTPDGARTEGAPQHVFVNPRLFDPLEHEGRQIVISHEAAHVALGAALLELPLWLSEGIADFVALSRSSTSMERLASQILELTRKRGAPRSLPGGPEFDGSDRRIGAYYEGAWLAVKRIADTYGEQQLWRFYRRAVRDGGTASAFRDVLGTSQRQFVGQWRAELTSLAS